ncbi:hypothetical protein [Labrys neptuniae]
MGVCSYCLKYEKDECFGWDEAKIHCGIDGPNDNRRMYRQMQMDREKIIKLRREADEFRQRAAKADAEADRLERKQTA